MSPSPPLPVYREAHREIGYASRYERRPRQRGETRARAATPQPCSTPAETPVQGPCGNVGESHPLTAWAGPVRGPAGRQEQGAVQVCPQCWGGQLARRIPRPSLQPACLAPAMRLFRAAWSPSTWEPQPHSVIAVTSQSKRLVARLVLDEAPKPVSEQSHLEDL